jgi:hypothetical protein
MKNLDQHVQKVWEERSPAKKRELIKEMIEYSDAKNDTKLTYLNKLNHIKPFKLDVFAVNYKLAGEGMKVI